MKKIDVAQAITIVANVGVIAGIVFLAIELRQNNQMMLSQTRSDISHNIADMLRQMATTEYLGDIGDPSELQALGSVEALRRQNWALANFRMWENIHYQWTRGLFEDSEYEKEKLIWSNNMSRPTSRQQFCDARGAFNVDFVREMESVMPQPC